MTLEKISVIIPTFNRVESTIKAVKSALDQSMPPYEVLVIDDGSEPQVIQRLILSILELNETKVKLILCNGLRHPGKVRNRGIAESSGDWIAFLDSDDTWLPRKTEKQIQIMKVTGIFASSAMSTSGTIESSQIQKQTHFEVDFRKLLSENFVVNSGVVISRKILQSVGNIADDYSVRGVEDYATWLRVATKTNWLVINDQLVYYSADSPDSIRLQSKMTKEFDMSRAHLDFILWQKNSSKNVILRKLIRKCIKFLVRFSKK